MSRKGFELASDNVNVLAVVWNVDRGGQQRKRKDF